MDFATVPGCEAFENFGKGPLRAMATIDERRNDG